MLKQYPISKICRNVWTDGDKVCFRLAWENAYSSYDLTPNPKCPAFLDTLLPIFNDVPTVGTWKKFYKRLCAIQEKQPVWPKELSDSVNQKILNRLNCVGTLYCQVQTVLYFENKDKLLSDLLTIIEEAIR